MYINTKQIIDKYMNGCNNIIELQSIAANAEFYMYNLMGDKIDVNNKYEEIYIQIDKDFSKALTSFAKDYTCLEIKNYLRETYSKRKIELEM